VWRGKPCKKEKRQDAIAEKGAALRSGPKGRNSREKKTAFKGKGKANW